MTNYNHTDKIIRSKYESFNPDFDAESMWNELYPVAEKDKRRGLFFWWIVGLVVGGLGLLTFSMLSTSDHNGQDRSQIVESMEEVSNKNIIQENQLNEYDNASHIIASNEADEDVNLASLTMDIHTPEVNKSRKESSKSLASNAAVNNSFYSDHMYTTFVSREAEAHTNEYAQYLEKNQNLSVNRELLSMNLLSPRQLELLHFQQDAAENISYPQMPIDNNVTLNYPMMKNSWRLGVNGGYYMHSRSFESIGLADNANYISRDGEEEAADGFDLGLKLEYFLSDHFAIIGGLRYSKAYVSRKADYTYQEQITVKDQVVAIVHTEMGTIEYTEDITYDAIFAHKANNYISATRLGLITGLQYNIGVGRWNTCMNLGLEVPFWDAHEGIITHDGKPYQLSDKTVLINKKSIQVFGGFGLEYTVANNAVIQTMIMGYTPISNEYVDSYSIKKKSTLVGINFGVQFKL